MWTGALNACFILSSFDRVPDHKQELRLNQLCVPCCEQSPDCGEDGARRMSLCNKMKKFSARDPYDLLSKIPNREINSNKFEYVYRKYTSLYYPYLG